MGQVNRTAGASGSITLTISNTAAQLITPVSVPVVKWYTDFARTLGEVTLAVTGSGSVYTASYTAPQAPATPATRYLKTTIEVSTGVFDVDADDEIGFLDAVAAMAAFTNTFATAAELEVLLQRTFTAAENAAVEVLLVQATKAVQSYAGQKFTTRTSTGRFKVTGGRVRLPQRPVTAVLTVKDINGRAILHTWDAGAQIYLSSGMVVANGPESWGDTGRHGAPTYVDVSYTHGYSEIPADVKAVVMQVASRAFGTPADTGGVQSETVGSYSYSLGSAAAAGAVGLLPAERAVLDRYRVPAGPIAMVR